MAGGARMRAARAFVAIPLVVALVGAGGWWLASTRAPEIGRDLPPVVREAEQAFDRRVRKRFPPGTPMTEVERALARQGFSSEPLEGATGAVEGGAGRHFDLRVAGFPCARRWQVVARGVGAVEDVRGTFGVVCL